MTRAWIALAFCFAMAARTFAQESAEKTGSEQASKTKAEILGFGGQERPEGAKTIVTSKTLDFDYRRKIAEFSGDVVVNDPQVNIKCDDMTIIFNTDDTVKSVTAVGNVSLSDKDKVATCERAIYLVDKGEIILTGEAVVTRGPDTLRGSRITIWPNHDRINCQDGTLEIFSVDQVKAAGSGGSKPASKPAEPGN